MAERDQRRKSHGPGPGGHDIKSLIKEGPAYSMGIRDKQTKNDGDQIGPNSYNPAIKSRAPKYTFGSKSGVTLGFGKLGITKSLRPGPGSYESLDVQFK